MSTFTHYEMVGQKLEAVFTRLQTPVASVHVKKQACTQGGVLWHCILAC